ncbi:MAG: zinc ABC transporter substrate-binding protein, partial [Sulfuricurvum sp.]|uniref:metal ABC transporter solute-binding protein, Zn/Mn family n=1 Tax=Sulfuricurvum sp. TaxID=2025608 RepID=UPI0026039ECB
GASQHTYEPKPAQMKELANSDAYFTIGDGFEKAWLPKFHNASPKMLIVDSIKGIEKIAMAEHHHEGEKAGAHQDHEEESLDPHVWLDPILVKTQAKNIYDALVTLYPAQTAEFTKNYEAFIVSIDALDASIQKTLSDIKSRKFIVFHPSFGYFAKRYNLEQIAIEVSGKEPKPSELATIIKEAKEENAKVVFVAPQFSQKSAVSIAKQINGKVVPIDPLAYAWSENLLSIAKTFQSELK